MLSKLKMLSDNTPPPEDSRELWKHFSDTYFSLRIGLAILGFAMPFVLYLYGQFGHGLDLQPSMSAYFWAAETGQCATFPMRTIFVGFLFAIGVALYMYKGLTPLENSLLNLAAICASLVAIFPERLSVAEGESDTRVAQLFKNCPAIKEWAAQPPLPIHYLAAVILFLLLAIVALFCAHKSLKYLPPDRDPTWFRSFYIFIGIAMFLLPIAGFSVAFLFGVTSHMVFYIETASILTFGIYWSVKTRELALSGLERDPEEAIEHAEKRQTVQAQAAKHGAS
jgi:hypothetical protein